MVFDFGGRMSVTSRRENILETAKKFNTLVELPDYYIDQVAQGGATPIGYTNHQIKAAKIAANQSGYQWQLILEWCSIERPPLFKGFEQKEEYYINWSNQHSITPKELAAQWVKRCNEESGIINRVYEYVEF